MTIRDQTQVKNFPHRGITKYSIFLKTFILYKNQCLSNSQILSSVVKYIKTIHMIVDN